jgi:transposase
MTDLAELTLRSQSLGALPVLQHVLDRLGLDGLLEQYVPHVDRRCRIRPATALGILLRNILLGRRPIYGLQEWAQPFLPSLLGLEPDQVGGLNDDRVGRALDRLFNADRASLMTTIVVRAIQAFDLQLDQFHNDSTSITFSGAYAQATGRKIRGRQAVSITHGHNKDHRPDLKQLLWILTVSADGSVPVHYRLCDGNTNDDPTHIQTWEALCRLTGRTDFMYVADCKLCTRANMDHIAHGKGRFITVLPGSRKEDAWFRGYIQDHDLPWEEVIRRPSSHGADRPDDLWRVVPAPNRSAEGYRIIWVWSQSLAYQHEQSRLAALQKAFDGIQELQAKLQGPHCRIRDRATVEEAVARILAQGGVSRWAEAEVTETNDTRFKQESRGHPGANTRYVKVERNRFAVAWKPKPAAIAYDARSDGMYPLVTNCDDLPAEDVLLKYKYQPNLEKRHEQLKTVYAVAPAFLKDEGRIEALLLLYFLALLVQALIERQVRAAMKGANLDVLPLYPEDRECKAPTTNRILEVFESIQRHDLMDGKNVYKCFEPKLTPLQEDLLRLLEVPRDLYGLAAVGMDS